MQPQPQPLLSITANRRLMLTGPSSSHMQLLTILRKLDCYKLTISDIQTSEIGIAVATLAAASPKLDVSRLATSLLQKWREMADVALFRSTAYDVEAAEAAPEGEPVAPEVIIAAEKEQARVEKMERRRRRIEEDFMASSSDEEMDCSQDSDPDFVLPKKNSQSSNGSGRTKRVYRSRTRALEAAAVTGGSEGANDAAMTTLTDPPSAEKENGMIEKTMEACV